MPTADIEREKYQRTWAQSEYRAACHSLMLWGTRRELFPEHFNSALDIGCGTGRLIAEWLRLGIDAHGVDIADNCLDGFLRPTIGDRFHLACLWEMDLGRRFDFGICTDVMEHIPPEYVGEVLRRIGLHCDEVLFKIAHVPDVCGGGTLHLTLQPWPWWVLQMVGGSVEYLGFQMRSGCEDSLIRWRPRG